MYTNSSINSINSIRYLECLNLYDLHFQIEYNPPVWTFSNEIVNLESMHSQFVIIINLLRFQFENFEI